MKKLDNAIGVFLAIGCFLMIFEFILCFLLVGDKYTFGILSTGFGLPKIMDLIFIVPFIIGGILQTIEYFLYGKN